MPRVDTPTFRNPPGGFYIAVACLGIAALPFQIDVAVVSAREREWLLLVLTFVTLCALTFAILRFLQAARLKRRKELIQALETTRGK